MSFLLFRQKHTLYNCCFTKNIKLRGTNKLKLISFTTHSTKEHEKPIPNDAVNDK